MTKEEYVRYVAEPKHLINPVREIVMFDRWYLEMLTKTPWYAIPIFWIPWIVYFFQFNKLDPLLTTVTIIFGIFLWTLLEYSLHRFVFHCEHYLPNHRLAFFLHFMIHGIHHAFP